MAKRKGVNKSQQIRNYLRKHPEASPKQVAQALKRFGITPAFVSTVKSQRQGKLPAQKLAAAKPAADLLNGATEPVLAAAYLIKLCGGLEPAKQALQTAWLVAGAIKS